MLLFLNLLFKRYLLPHHLFILVLNSEVFLHHLKGDLVVSFFLGTPKVSINETVDWVGLFIESRTHLISLRTLIIVNHFHCQFDIKS